MIDRLSIAIAYKSKKEEVSIEDVSSLLEIFGDKYSTSVRRKDSKGVMLQNMDADNSIKFEIDKIIVQEKSLSKSSIESFCSTLVNVFSIAQIEELKHIIVQGQIVLDYKENVSSIILNNTINPTYLEKVKNLGQLIAIGIRNVYIGTFGATDVRIEPLFEDMNKLAISIRIINDENVNISNICKIINSLFEESERHISLIK